MKEGRANERKLDDLLVIGDQYLFTALDTEPICLVTFAVGSTRPL